MIRSEEMMYYSLVCSRESSWEIINKLGAIDCLHFQDMHPDLMHTSKKLNIDRPFAKNVKRCDELLLKID